MSACLVFVFAGLLEYALVNVIARKGELKQQVRFSKEVIGNRLAQVHFYRKDEAQGATETMETLVHKTNANTNERNAAHGHYAPISNTNTATPSAAPIAQQVVVSQPAPIAKAAKPVRDNAQFVDLVSAVLFPVAFIVFNIIYWMVYLNMQVEYILK